MLQLFKYGDLLMKSRWIGLSTVALVAIAIIAYKQKSANSAVVATKSATPEVLLVVNPEEENEKGGCGDIIHAVRETGKRGIEVRELPPNSSSDLLQRYRILTAPTVLILDRHGNITDRFEGEESKTVDAIRAKLASLSPEDWH